jgi:hypothetical protein
MKRNSLLIAVIFLISICFSFQKAEAQEKIKDEKEKELRIKEAIDAQKKAFLEQEKAQQEMKKALEDSKVDVWDEAIMDSRVKAYDPENLEKIYKVYGNMRGDRSFSTGEPIVITPGVEFFGHSYNDSERTSWNFSKYVKETSFSRDYTFDVESTVKTVVMVVNGDCKSGEIRIKIVMPGGKTYSDILIDEFGNLNWRKSFTISDSENKDKAGAWKFEISSSKATGYFKISLETY